MSDRSYPLHWPENWPRTKTRASSRFDTTLAKALKNVEDEIGRFANDSGKKITSLAISSNYSLGRQNPDDPGVAVYFTWDEIPTCIAVDRYTRIQDNLQAIYHCLNAERTKLRHGGINLVRAAFRGYAALPPPAPEGTSWWATLGVDKSAQFDVIEAKYRKLRSQHHPDKGGDPEKFNQILQAFEQATLAFSR